MDAASMASLIAHSDLFGRMLETSLDDARVASGSIFRAKSPSFSEVHMYVDHIACLKE